MPQQYKVKSGDTLWGISQKYLGSGQRWKELGYQGRPESLQVGTMLNIPSQDLPQERAVEMSSQLSGETPADTQSESKLGAFDNGKYNIGSIQKDLMSATTEKKKSYDEMMGMQASLYEEEYGKAGLDATKQKISGIDTSIQERKAQRDAMLLDERGKPIPQWMITGRTKLELDASTGDLNRLIDQRNTMAGEYNAGVENVTRKVGYGVKDAGTKYGYWEGEEKRLTDMMQDYQSSMSKELGREEDAERWEKEFALRLQKMNKEAEGTDVDETKDETKEAVISDAQRYADMVMSGSPMMYNDDGTVNWARIPQKLRTEVDIILRKSGAYEEEEEPEDKWTLGKILPWRTSQEQESGKSWWRGLLPW